MPNILTHGPGAAKLSTSLYSKTGFKPNDGKSPPIDDANIHKLPNSIEI